MVLLLMKKTNETTRQVLLITEQSSDKKFGEQAANASPCSRPNQNLNFVSFSFLKLNVVKFNNLHKLDKIFK